MKLSALNEEIANLNDERSHLRAKWQSEKEIVEKIQQKKNEIENLKFEADQAERDGDFGKVAEIRYGQLKAIEDEIEEYKKKLIAIQGDSPMLNEEVMQRISPR